MLDQFPFHQFGPDIHQYDLPKHFTYPFNYEAHPLCIIAATQVQHWLSFWQCDEHFVGKMFGVLIVKNMEGELGFLAAYSGNLLPQFDSQYFVPPIYDPTVEGGYFRQGENELIQLNKQIVVLQNAKELEELKQEIVQSEQKLERDIKAQKAIMLTNKQTRQQRRVTAEAEKDGDDLKVALDRLNQESLAEKNTLRHLKRDGKTQLSELGDCLHLLLTQIDELKTERKTKSAALQQWLFDQYELLNVNSEVKSLCNIFESSIGGVPPAGAGDCAAPRLLQYAFQQKMQVISMAEFWWGGSPKTVIRKHGNFYPSCSTKCKPILGHMLDGLVLDPDPLLASSTTITLDVVYADDSIVVINKPPGILSVPGKNDTLSMYDIVVKHYPNALSVHRLDMATSGILIYALSEEVHKLLQAQFISRKVKKRYVALLEGTLEQENGKIELPLRVDLDNRPSQMVCYQHGKPAMTLWRVLKREHGKTRINFFPITGRTHQLRVHAAHELGLGCPIVGDNLYGKASERLCLHAERLELLHPLTGKKITFERKADF